MAARPTCRLLLLLLRTSTASECPRPPLECSRAGTTCRSRRIPLLHFLGGKQLQDRALDRGEAVRRVQQVPVAAAELGDEGQHGAAHAPVDRVAQHRHERAVRRRFDVVAGLFRTAVVHHEDVIDVSDERGDRPGDVPLHAKTRDHRRNPRAATVFLHVSCRTLQRDLPSESMIYGVPRRERSYLATGVGIPRSFAEARVARTCPG